MKDVYGQKIHLRHAAAGMLLLMVAMDIYSDPWLIESKAGRLLVVGILLVIGGWHMSMTKLR